MNSIRIPSFTPSGRVTLPGSKSYTQRALAAALLADGDSVILNPSLSEDARHALEIIRTLGARVEEGDGEIRVSGNLRPVKDTLDCGESGLAMRLFSPVAALHAETLILKAGGSLRKRPVDMIAGPLRELGASCQTSQGFPPVRVRGPLRGGMAAVDGSQSSQFLSGLLMALPLAEKDSVLQVTDLKSKPYVDMTLDVLRDFGVKNEHTQYQRFIIPGNQVYQPTRYEVEGDWSGAAFFLVAGAIRGRLGLLGLDPDSLQADRAILQVLEQAGVKVQWTAGRLEVSEAPLRAFAFDATDCPDLFPPLVPLAAWAEGKSRIRGVSRLYAKESDRARVLVDEFRKFGIRTGISGDEMWIEGPPDRPARIDPHGDHRIAMAASVMAAGPGIDAEITDPACVAKSYPAFFNDLERIGGKMI